METEIAAELLQMAGPNIEHEDDTMPDARSGEAEGTLVEWLGMNAAEAVADERPQTAGNPQLRTDEGEDSAEEEDGTLAKSMWDDILECTQRVDALVEAALAEEETIPQLDGTVVKSESDGETASTKARTTREKKSKYAPLVVTGNEKGARKHKHNKRSNKQDQHQSELSDSIVVGRGHFLSVIQPRQEVLSPFFSTCHIYRLS